MQTVAKKIQAFIVPQDKFLYVRLVEWHAQICEIILRKSFSSLENFFLPSATLGAEKSAKLEGARSGQ